MKPKKIKPKLRRLVAEIPEDLHQMVKTRALKKKLTVREWLSLAITELISKEMIEEI